MAKDVGLTRSFLFAITVVLVIVFLSCKKEKIDLYADYQTDNPMIHREGTNIVDGSGQAIKLKGCIPLGWLQWEGTVWNCGLRAEKKMRERITDMVGEEGYAAYYRKRYCRNGFNGV